MPRMRIHKALANAGVASRRAVEEMILDGRISVNGKLVIELPCFVDLDADEVRVDGRRVRGHKQKNVYYLLNKPRGVVCTQSDPQGRPRAIDLIPEIRERVYCVGRLDVDSTGLILLTNDGELTEQLTHPRYGVRKVYAVEVDGRPTADAIARLKAGMHLEGKRTQKASVKMLRRSAQRSLLAIGLSEGRNREIRRLLARLGHRVRRLKRTAIGPVTDRGLKIGNWRRLHPAEVKALRRCGGGGGEPKDTKASRTRPSRQQQKGETR